MKWNEVLTVYAVSLIAAGCGTVIPDRVEEALALAGENRYELERVLVHYSGDSLRLGVARHLIGYMPGHFSYRDRTRGRDERIFTYENGEQVWW